RGGSHTPVERLLGARQRRAAGAVADGEAAAPAGGVRQSDVDRTFDLRVRAVMQRPDFETRAARPRRLAGVLLLSLAALIAAGTLAAAPSSASLAQAAQQPAEPPAPGAGPAPQQPSDIE